MDHKQYDSALCADDLTVTAPYFNAIRPTTVSFVQEKRSVTMDSLGHIAFFDEAGQPLGAVDFPVSDDPSKYGHTAQYGQIRCRADGKTITISLPVYGWDDNYPHCDGESDRWDRYVARWFQIHFDCADGTITVEGR